MSTKTSATAPSWMVSRSWRVASVTRRPLTRVPLALRSSRSPVRVRDDHRVAPRDALVVEADVGREAAADVRHRPVQRHQARDLALFDREVTAGGGALEREAVAARAVAEDPGRLVRLRRGLGGGAAVGGRDRHGDISARAAERSLNDS
jgi:hypothetical protein